MEMARLVLVRVLKVSGGTESERRLKACLRAEEVNISYSLTQSDMSCATALNTLDAFISQLRQIETADQVLSSPY
jgi:hypothetical protein